MVLQNSGVSIWLLIHKTKQPKMHIIRADQIFTCISTLETVTLGKENNVMWCCSGWASVCLYFSKAPSKNDTQKNLHNYVHPAPASWSGCRCVGTCHLPATIHYLWDVCHHLESLLLCNFFGFYYNTHFLCAQTAQMTFAARWHIYRLAFIFLSQSNFFSPGILPSSLDGKKFMWSSKLLLFGLCLCAAVCVFSGRSFFCFVFFAEA